MPNRMLKESILSSEKFNSLTWFEQSTYIRLILLADDYGRLDGRDVILKSYCYPLDDKVTRSAISKAISHMVNVGLLQKYEVNNKPYLYFPNFGKYQRLRSKTSKYPAPLNGAQNDSCQSHDRHMSDTCPLEEEVEVEEELEVEEKENLKEKAATVVPENSKKTGNSFSNANVSAKANDTETIQAMLEKYDLPLKTELMHFIESRRNMRKPLNAYAFELALDKLNSLSTDTEEQIAIVKQAIANGWQGFYPLKSNGNGKSYSMHVKPLPDYMNKKGEVNIPEEEYTTEEREKDQKELEEELRKMKNCSKD